MRGTLGGGLSSNQFVTNGFLGALDPRRVSRASHYASEKIFKKFLEFLGADPPCDEGALWEGLT